MDVISTLWTVAAVLVALVVFQLVFLVFLNALPTRRREKASSNRVIAPSVNGSPFAEPAAHEAYPQQPIVPPPPVIANIPTNMPTPAPSSSGARRAPAPTPAPAASGVLPSPAASAPRPAPAAPAPMVMPPAPIPAIAVPNLPESTPGGGRKLIVLSGLPELFEINLPGTDFGIGRFFNQERKVLVMFDEKSVSREHALFNYNAQLDQYFITDKSSSYGTYVLVDNKFEPMTPERPERIFNGDVVQFGNMVKVRFILPGETRASMTAL